ncbi:UNVERIFIED_ORG: type II secretion system (T2SS) protein C [Pseudomonas psychrophila]
MGAIIRHLPLILKVLLWGTCFGYGAHLAWQEWLYRQALAVPVIAPARPAPAPALEPFQPEAIASVLGLAPQGALAHSAEPLELRASLVSSHGASQALLAGSQQARFYRVGERLPGGSVLRRIEVSYVVLWRNNREERLLLKPPGRHVLPAGQTPATPAQATSLYLRPLAEQP